MGKIDKSNYIRPKHYRKDKQSLFDWYFVEIFYQPVCGKLMTVEQLGESLMT